MAKAPQKPRPYGAVLVSDEIRQLIGREQIGNAIAHLRMGGGNCWVCHKPFRRTDPVSFVIDRASTALRLGFMHLHHGPSQIRELRDDRRASVATYRRLMDKQDDVTGFVSFREYPSPRALLVVSPWSPLIFGADGGNETRSPWLEYWMERGLETITPPVIDAAPHAVAAATAVVSDRGEIFVTIGDSVLFEGCLPMPVAWLEALQEEQRCMVVVSALGIVSDELDYQSSEALDALGSRGLLIGGTVAATTARAAATTTLVG